MRSVDDADRSKIYCQYISETSQNPSFNYLVEHSVFLIPVTLKTPGYQLGHAGKTGLVFVDLMVNVTRTQSRRSLLDRTKDSYQ
jgi:hypothetical protein